MARDVLPNMRWAGFSLLRFCVRSLFGQRGVPTRYGMCSIRPLDTCQKSHVINISKLCGIKDVGMQQKWEVPYKCEVLFPVFSLFYFFHFRFFSLWQDLSSTSSRFCPRNKPTGTNGTGSGRLHHVTLVESLRQIGFSGTRGSRDVQSYRSLHLDNRGTSKGGRDL